jgi:hypothetical protein
MELDIKGNLELKNQEFLLNMVETPPISFELKERMLKNITKLLSKTNDKMEIIRIKTVIIQLNDIKSVS